MLTDLRETQMNKILIFILLSYSYVFGQLNTYPTEIRCDQKLFVKIDGKYVGETPLKLDLSSGRHHFFLFKDIREWGIGKVSDSVVLSPKSDRIFIYNTYEYKLLDTHPQDAALESRGIIIGHTPALVNSNFENIKFIKRGFETIEHKNKTINSLQPVNLIPIEGFHKSEESFVESAWFKVMLSSAVIFGASAAYFKMKADKTYDNYLAEKKNSLLDKTNNYDTISAVSLGLLEVNIAAIVYFLLDDNF